MNGKSLASLLALLLVCASLPWLAGCVDDSDADDGAPRNVIFMVPDGMGLSNVTALRTYLGGPGGDSLSFETLPYIGYQRTYSRNSFVTDSAAAASAWACGEKFNNNEVSCHDNDGDGVCDDAARAMTPTVLKVAQNYGLGVGLVATSDITHATPAVWASNVHSRYCESEIFRQETEEYGVNVLLGGGVALNRSSCKLEHTDSAYNEALIENAQNTLGYAYATTKDELTTAVSAAPTKLLGLFNNGGLTPQYVKSAASTQPTLKEMTDAALSVLQNFEKGFFLMIEGSQIDWASHARNTPYQVGEVKDFDDSVKAVREWIAADATRSANTLLIVVADHETGGAILEGPYGSQASAGDSDTQAVSNTGDPLYTDDGAVVYEPNFQMLFGSNFANYSSSANHTGVDTIVWSNNAACAKAMENTDLYQIMVDYIEGVI